MIFGFVVVSDFENPKNVVRGSISLVFLPKVFIVTVHTDNMFEHPSPPRFPSL